MSTCQQRPRILPKYDFWVSAFVESRDGSLTHAGKCATGRSYNEPRNRPLTHTVAINSNGRTARLTLNNSIIAIDGANVELEVPAQIINGRMYVPLGVLVERILGKKIFYSDGLIIISDRENIFDADLEIPKVEQVKKLFK